MHPAHRRRLDALIVLCSAMLGLAVTVLFLSEMAGPLLFVFALVPTAVIALVALTYADGSISEEPLADG
ncbi:hypothetical protein ACFR9U_03510 [Halorientalis brevis]|uniref:Uncharacterized protein n=1 Tax=Halorientalis brevis TaxID=1126241 RepID=A0ABD6C8K0_9EURY|nr:hypothetical protein [Halorientalis brevis]